MASTNPTQQAAPVASSGGYVVQVSSQRSEGDAQASFRALQTKFPSVLGSRAPLIKKADLGDKGTYYRAMVGPFGSQEEASQVCGNLKSAGGQCVVQRN
jgi:cell division protein FtsN